jgi:hypothetical protein
MESLVNRILMPIALVGCLVLLMNQPDPEANDPAIDEEPAARVVAIRLADRAELPPEKEGPLLRFGGYPCRDDCSEHQAGYQWAEEHGISDADNCDGLSAAFIEGCRVYAESRTVAVASLN